MEPYKTWQCGTCGFLYDEAEGLPQEGIPPATRWKDISEDWVCPDCGMAKNQFEMVEI
jgi:rubredoxin